MSFWEYNRRKLLVWSVLIASACGLYVWVLAEVTAGAGFLIAAFATAFMFTIALFATVFPAANSFKVISRLTDELANHNIIGLFEKPPEIHFKNVKSRFSLTVPFIEGEVEGLPVIISYQNGARGEWSYISFSFGPLAKLGSKRVYYDHLSFKLYIKKALKRDIKQDVKNFVLEKKEKGFVSGKGRPLSTKHLEQYAE
jgi:hypothetical protein